MGSKNFSRLTKVSRDTEESLTQVASTPGAIGYATASDVVSQKEVQVKPLPLAFNKKSPYVPPFSGTDIHKVNQHAFTNRYYPITRELYIIIKKDGGLDEQAGTAFANMLLSIEGQKLIAKAGYAPIRQLPNE